MEEDDNLIEMPGKNTSMFKLIKHLLENLFIAEHRRLDKSIADLIRANNETKRTQAAGFLFFGEYYTAEGFQQVGNNPKVQLDDSLKQKMEWHLKDAETVANDRRLIGQIVYKLTDPCTTLQDMRDSLPDCLSTMIPVLKSMPRHNEVGWSLRQDTRSTKQFNKLLPKIEMYSAARLLY